jgi:hypothetical protein
MTESSAFVNEVFRKLHSNIRNAIWMGCAAKFCSRFLLAIPVVANYVIVTDSMGDSQEEDENEQGLDERPHGNPHAIS